MATFALISSRRLIGFRRKLVESQIRFLRPGIPARCSASCLTCRSLISAAMFDAAPAISAVGLGAENPGIAVPEGKPGLKRFSVNACDGGPAEYTQDAGASVNFSICRVSESRSEVNSRRTSNWHQ